MAHGGETGNHGVTFTDKVEHAIESGDFKKPFLNEVRLKIAELQFKDDMDSNERKELRLAKEYMKLMKESLDKSKGESENLSSEVEEGIVASGELLPEDKKNLEKQLANLSKIVEKIKKAKADAHLKPNWFTLGELDFIKCDDELARAIGFLLTKDTPLYDHKDLKAGIGEAFKQINYAREAHDLQMQLDSDLHKRRRVIDPILEDFFHKMSHLEKRAGLAALTAAATAESAEVQEAAEFKERVQKAEPNELLEMYKETPEDDLMKRSIIVHALMSRFIFTEDNSKEIEKQTSGKLKGRYQLKEGSEGAAELNPILAEIDPNHIDSFKLSATLENIDFDIEDGLSISSVANAIMEKYEIKLDDGSPAKFEDLHDPERKDDLKTIIETARDSAGEDKEKAQDLQYLLDLKDLKPKEFMNDLVNVGNFRLIENEFLEDGELWAALGEKYDGRNMERIIEKVLTGNGGMNMIFLVVASIYAMFKGKGKHVFIGAGALLGLQTIEENFAGTGAQKKMSELLNNIAPGLGGMIDGVMDKTGFSKPKYEISFMDPEFEDTYRDLYLANTKKLEEGKFSDAVNEEDFAHIYAQLMANDDFRTAKVSDIAAAASKSDTAKNVLGTQAIDKYKDSLVNNLNDEETDSTRKLSQSKVALVMKMLLDNRDHSDDATGADLFAKGKAEGLSLAGGKEFTEADQAVKEAYAKITSDNPEYNNVKAVVDSANAWWKPENYKKLVGIDGERESQLDKMIAALAVSVSTVGGGEHAREIRDLMTALEALRDRAGLVERKDEFLRGTRAGTDSRWFGTEGLVKSGVDKLAYAGVVTAHFLGAEKLNLPQTDDISIADINAKIEEGNDLLATANDEEKEEINTALAELRLYKIERQRVEGTPDDVTLARKEYMTHNADLFMRQLTDMEGSMSKLANPNLDTIDDFYTVAIENMENLAILEEYISVDPENEEVVALIKHKDSFEENISKKVASIGAAYVPFSSWDTKIDTRTSSNIGELEREYNILRANLLDEDITTTLKSKLKSGLNWFDGVNLDEVEQNKLVIISKITGITSIDDNARDYENAIIAIETKIAEKREELDQAQEDDNETALNDKIGSLPTPYTKDNIDQFIDGIKDVNKFIDENDVYSDGVSGDAIRNYISSIITAVYATTDENERKEIFNDFKKLKDKIGTGGQYFMDSSEGNTVEAIMKGLLVEKVEAELELTLMSASINEIKFRYPEAHIYMENFTELYSDYYVEGNMFVDGFINHSETGGDLIARINATLDADQIVANSFQTKVPGGKEYKKGAADFAEDLARDMRDFEAGFKKAAKGGIGIALDNGWDTFYNKYIK